MVQFNLLPTLPGAYPHQGFAIFFFLGCLFPTLWARRKRQFPTPELVMDFTCVVLGTTYKRVILISAQEQNETFLLELLNTFCKHEY